MTKKSKFMLKYDEIIISSAVLVFTKVLNKKKACYFQFLGKETDDLVSVFVSVKTCAPVGTNEPIFKFKSRPNEWKKK